MPLNSRMSSADSRRGILLVRTATAPASCSFASPVGYQTNLLVMAPGHYRFVDYVRSGLPLLLLIWACFTAFAPWYYGLPLSGQ